MSTNSNSVIRFTSLLGIGHGCWLVSVTTDVAAILPVIVVVAVVVVADVPANENYGRDEGNEIGSSPKPE